ncbi:MAG: energy transducer TonB [Sphingomonadales bacterium]|nr:energy transducer TonB [Sphingomonadales bacterium]
MANDIFNAWDQPESADRLAMVFEGRLKDYGAFYVRSIYRKSKVVATVIACSAVLIAASIPLIIEKMGGKDTGKPSKIVITTLEDVKPPEEEEEQPKEQPKIEEPEPIATQAYVAPIINEQTTEEFETPPVSSITNASTKTQQGVDDPFDGSTGTGGGSPIEGNNEPALIVQREAKFPGGDEAFKRFIVANFEYPERCRDEGIEGYVQLKFVVDVNGRISRIQIIQPTPGCPEFDKEAIRVLQKCPPWIPAQNNGKFLTSWRTLPIRLLLQQ